MSGSSGPDSFYRPMYFMDRDVVIVSINYRLHVLGEQLHNHRVRRLRTSTHEIVP
jgi:carboxylesterase type B